jgi:ADP-heptose:LPS heptosyltransferase
MKASIFSCSGLGDGLVFLTLLNNLRINNFDTTFYHNNFDLTNFFDAKIKKYPEISNIDEILKNNDLIFISFDKSNPFINELIKKSEKYFFRKIFVLNPSPTKKIKKLAFYDHFKFDRNLTVIENLKNFSKNILNLKDITISNNIIIPKNLTYRKNKNLVAIHPSSGNKNKNFDKSSFIKIAKKLKNKNFEPIFIVSPKEEKEFLWVRENNFNLKTFNGLNELASFIFEVGYLIGNDSGLGHLASNLNIPSISIFKNLRTAKLWRPGWGKNKIIYPNNFIPNLSFFRLRDKYWQKFISIKKIIKNCS